MTASARRVTRWGVLLILGAGLSAQEPPAPPPPDPLGQEQEQEQQGRQEEPEVLVLDEVVITALAGAWPSLEVPRSVTVVDAQEIRDRLVLTTPDALHEEPGLVVQKTNLGGGSLLVRGRSGKDVLLLVDGQRFNNSTFRRNHQYLNTIDPSVIQRLEVVRGPTSVLYGSDAMGGAVNVITRRREVTGVTGLEGLWRTTYESAAAGWSSHLGLSGETGEVGVDAGLTLRHFDDLRAGRYGNPAGAIDRNHRQDPTGYDQVDANLSLVHPLSEDDALDLLFLYSRARDVPRSDVLIGNAKRPVPPDLKHEVDPQVLRWWQLRFRHDDPERDGQGFQAVLTLHNPEESRERIRASAPTQEIREEDELWIPGMTLRWSQRPVEDHLVTVGADGYFERVDSSRSTRDLTTGAVTADPNGRYPDGARYQSLGVFAEDQWDLADHWRWVNGVRYSQVRARYDLDGLVVGPLGPFGRQDETYDDVTFSSGLSVEVRDGTWLYGSVSRGFRAPNLDDLAVLGDFASGERVPSVDLDPESVWNLEVGARHSGPRLWGGVAASVALYRDLLDSEVAFVQGGTTYFQVGNADRALIYSIEAWGETLVRESDGHSPEQSVFANLTVTMGRNRSMGEPLSKVPPPQGELGYRLRGPAEDWFADAFLRGAVEQDRLSGADRSDPRIPVGGTPAWWTCNLRGGVDLRENLHLGLGIENLFDHRYRVHGSGIDAPGRNVVVTVGWTF